MLCSPVLTLYNHAQHLLVNPNDIEQNIWLGALDIHPTEAAIVVEYFVEIIHKDTCEILDRQKFDKM